MANTRMGVMAMLFATVALIIAPTIAKPGTRFEQDTKSLEFFKEYTQTCRKPDPTMMSPECELQILDGALDMTSQKPYTPSKDCCQRLVHRGPRCHYLWTQLAVASPVTAEDTAPGEGRVTVPVETIFKNSQQIWDTCVSVVNGTRVPPA